MHGQVPKRVKLLEFVAFRQAHCQFEGLVHATPGQLFDGGRRNGQVFGASQLELPVKHVLNVKLSEQPNGKESAVSQPLAFQIEFNDIGQSLRQRFCIAIEPLDLHHRGKPLRLRADSEHADEQLFVEGLTTAPARSGSRLSLGQFAGRADSRQRQSKYNQYTIPAKPAGLHRSTLPIRRQVPSMSCQRVPFCAQRSRLGSKRISSEVLNSLQRESAQILTGR